MLACPVEIGLVLTDLCVSIILSLNTHQSAYDEVDLLECTAVLISLKRV